MTNKIRILWDNAADRGVVTATSAVITQNNLLTNSKNEVWRTAGSSSSLFTNNSVDSNNGWSKGANTTRVGFTTAPDGTNTAVAYSTTAAANAYVFQNVTLAANTRYNITVYAKLVSGPVPSGSLIYAAHDTDGNGGTAEITSLAFASITTSWQQFNLVVDNVAAYPTAFIAFGVDFNTGTQVAFWGAEIKSVTKSTVSTSWDTGELISCVAFPYCNFSPTATMRVRLYSDTAGTVLVYDSGTVICTGNAAIKVAGLTLAQSSSAYSYGGGSCAVVYTVATETKKIVIDILDVNNLQGYLEASRLVIGEYFTPTHDAQIGASISFEDTGKNFRNDAGNLKSDIGTRNKVIDFNLSALLELDRKAAWKIVSYCGTSYPVFISLYPEHSDKDLEQAHTVYGKFSNVTKIASKAYGVYEAPMTVEGI